MSLSALDNLVRIGQLKSEPRNTKMDGRASLAMTEFASLAMTGEVES